MPSLPGFAVHKLSRVLLRHRRSVFAVAVFFAFTRSGFSVGHEDVVPLIPDIFKASQTESPWMAKDGSLLVSSGDHPRGHPIPSLMEDAEAKYKRKLRSQSRSLRKAVVEYRRRYKRDPPKGFDQWFEFARENAFHMTDEFDGLMSDLEPFWQLSGEELRRRCRQVAGLPSIDLVRIENGTSRVHVFQHGVKDQEANARAYNFLYMLKRFVHILPDMAFPINAKAESRVIVPWEHQKYPYLTVQNSSGGIESVLGGPFTHAWQDDGSVWDLWRLSCPPNSPARRGYSATRNSVTPNVDPHLRNPEKGPGQDFKFVKDTSAQLDFCMHPHARYTQGHFFSDWRIIPALYPVFSPAKAKGFMDIRIPSHYYWGSTPLYTYGWDPVNLQLLDSDPMEVPWEEKVDKIFWRGATTGGGSTPAGFTPSYHRHRFIHMASDTTDTNRSVTYADPPSSTTNFVTTQISVKKLNDDIMDTAFTKALSPESYPGGLKAMHEAHRFGNTVPLGRHWSYRYLIDLDGMSYSGRFMAFLASDSVPIKSTVYEEFFSDWIQPWVHFIPLSTTYKEIYNIFAYFTGPTEATLEAANSTLANVPISKRRYVEGDRRLRKIARAGKQWKKSLGRKSDMEAYVYRLCLEWARLSADNRDAMSYKH